MERRPRRGICGASKRCAAGLDAVAARRAHQIAQSSTFFIFATTILSCIAYSTIVMTIYITISPGGNSGPWVWGGGCAGGWVRDIGHQGAARGHARSAALRNHGRGGAITAYTTFQVRVVEGPPPAARCGRYGATLGMACAAVACKKGAPASPTPTRTALRAAQERSVRRNRSTCGCSRRYGGSVLSSALSFVDGHTALEL